MKHTGTKRILSLLAAFCILFAALPLAEAQPAAKTYETGDYVIFGAYPQRSVYKYSDTELYAALEAQQKNWKSYGYYSGNSDGYSLEEDNPLRDGKMKPGDFMQYADFNLNGKRYRAVTFDQYRPDDTGEKPDTGTYQKTNIYYTGQVHYFEYEPIAWRVLDPKTGLVVSENLLDAQPFNNTIYYASSEYWQTTEKKYYANNYAESSIREWLLNDFYNTAFTREEQAKIKTTSLDNSGSVSKYNGANTADKIFLLSQSDLLNTAYGFSSSGTGTDPSRYAYGTDYAECQGLRVQDYQGSRTECFWWLRTPGSNSAAAEAVINTGSVGDGYYSTTYTFYGVRPAFCFSGEITDSWRLTGTTGDTAGAGDISGDGAVTAEDARLALRAAVELESYPAASAQYIAADVNGDKKITAEDARLILRAAVGLEVLREPAPDSSLQKTAMAAYRAEIQRMYQLNSAGRNADTMIFALYDIDENGMLELILYNGYKTDVNSNTYSVYTYTFGKGLVHLGYITDSGSEVFADHTKGDGEIDVLVAYHDRAFSHRYRIENGRLVQVSLEIGHIDTGENSYFTKYKILNLTADWTSAAEADAYFQ